MATVNKGDVKAIGILLMFLITIMICLIAFSAKADNRDYKYLDSCFRKMETVYMKKIDFNGRQFYPDKKVKGPRDLDKKEHVWTITNASFNNFGIDMSATSWDDAHNTQTFRTFNMEHINFYNCDVGIIIQGSHRSHFDQVSAYGCRVGGYFELCLEGMATQLQAHTFRDTGFYVGWCFNLAGANRENSQSNNFKIYGFRSYGAGTGTALIYNCVYGGVVEGLCDEGYGCDVFLLIDAANSTTMKLFKASGFGDIECHNNEAVVKVIGNGTWVYLEDFYVQVANCLVSGQGNSSTIFVKGLPDTNVDITFSNLGQGVNSLWWKFEEFKAKNGTIYNDANWLIDKNHSKPPPYAPGQTTNNSGSNRLYEIPAFN
jgi:hypothetical protein